MEKTAQKIILILLSGGMLMLSAASCCIADWTHDLWYRDAPPPTEPIAPPAPPMPEEYSTDDAAALMTDSLIFAVSGLSSNGIPCLVLHAESGITGPILPVFGELVRNRVINTVRPDGMPPEQIYSLFSTLTGNEWNVTLETQAPERKTIFNMTVKLKQ